MCPCKGFSQQAADTAEPPQEPWKPKVGKEYLCENGERWKVTRVVGRLVTAEMGWRTETWSLGRFRTFFEPMEQPAASPSPDRLRTLVATAQSIIAKAKKRETEADCPSGWYCDYCGDDWLSHTDKSDCSAALAEQIIALADRQETGA